MEENNKKPSFAIVGCGRVGTALAVEMIRLGYELKGLSCKTEASAVRASDIIETDNFSTTSWTISKDADIVFITTPDGIIADTYNELCENNGIREGAIVLHCSGSLSSSVFSDKKCTGVFKGSLHPLQSFVKTDFSVNPFKGIIISVEGEEGALGTAKQIASELGGRCLTIPTDSKVLYHAAAVVASNYLVTLLDFSFKLNGEAGITESESIDILAPLIEGTLGNIRANGIKNALTGPIARGDIETIEAHIQEIDKRLPELLKLYKTMGEYTIDVADNMGSIDQTSKSDLEKILKEK